MGCKMEWIGMVRHGMVAALLGIVALQVSPAPCAAQADAMRAGFENPPQSAKLRCYWWWLNGNTTEAAIDRDLHAMKAKGYGGAILVDANGSDQGGNRNVPPGPLFGSPQWVKLYLHALDVARQLGLEISLNAGSGWNLGGPGVTPQDAAKVLTFSRSMVAGGGVRTVPLPMPPTKNGFYRPIAVLAYPLRHGAPLAGEAQSERRAILDLQYKTASTYTGISMPLSSLVLRELPPTSGEEDTQAGQVIDVSAQVAEDGTLKWTFPAGAWEVLRIGYTDSGAQVSTSSGAWQGLMMDYMSREAFDHYWYRVLAPLIAVAKPYVGSSLRYLVEDSWEETGGENWTEGFREEFRKRRGYDLLPYLPAVAGRIVDDRETTNRFLADLRRTVADMVAVNHYDYFAEHAARYGLGTHPESGGPHGDPIDGLENFRESSFPQTEFWAMSDRHRVTGPDRFFVKEAASAAHIYGKPFVAGEGFTSLGLPWSESPGFNLKPTFDQALTEGLNRLYWHEFTSEPLDAGLPGNEYFAGTHLNPNTTWWGQAGPVLLAMNRAQFLMQQGRPISDLLYYRGEQVPGFARLNADDPARVLPGYDYDVISEDALLHRIVTARGKLRTPEGVSYQALALPRSGFLSLASLRWVEKFVQDGGLLIGPRPRRPLGLLSAQDETEYERIAERVWSGCKTGAIARYGAGRIDCTLNAHEALRAFGVAPDLEVDGQAHFDFVHRQTPDAEIYFVRNTEDKPAQATFSFRVSGRAPELWQVDSGEIATAPVYEEAQGRTNLPVTFPPRGSVFIVFEGAPETHAVHMERDGAAVFPSIVPGAGVFGEGRTGLGTTQPGRYKVSYSDGSSRDFVVAAPVPASMLDANWTLQFPPHWGAPASVPWGQFASWTDSTNAGIRYFSGTATYRGILRVAAAPLNAREELWIDLGEVREVATVRVNGKRLTTLWHPPFRARIDAVLHPGENTVEIDVSNLWANRLIGDSQPGAQQYGQTNITTYKSDSRLTPSGLLTRPAVYVVQQMDVHGH